MQTYQKLPGDDWFEDLDPIVYRYMYEHWCRDQEEKQELIRMGAILSGSFVNPQAARDMVKAENPEYQSSEEDFAKSLEMVKEHNNNLDEKIPRRRRRLLKKE
jgi:hypothetical protein